MRFFQSRLNLYAIKFIHQAGICCASLNFWSLTVSFMLITAIIFIFISQNHRLKTKTWFKSNLVITEVMYETNFNIYERSQKLRCENQIKKSLFHFSSANEWMLLRQHNNEKSNNHIFSIQWPICGYFCASTTKINPSINLNEDKHYVL